MRVTICIGSACHLKGSREVVETFQRLVKEKHYEDQVDLQGSFCSNNCEHGVCVTVDGELFSVSPDTAEMFFNEIIEKGIKA